VAHRQTDDAGFALLSSAIGGPEIHVSNDVFRRQTRVETTKKKSANTIIANQTPIAW